MTTKLFGRVYDSEVGSIEKDLLLKTRGEVKIQIGKRFIDLIKNGKIVNSNESIFYNVQSTDQIDKDGIYLIDGNIFIKINDKVAQITQTDNSEAFVSITLDQQTTPQQKKISRKNIGLDYQDTTDALQKLDEGIVFIGDTIYYISNGNCVEYKIDKFNSIENDIQNINRELESITNNLLDSMQVSVEVEAESESNILNVYNIIQNNEIVGSISIPKDLVIERGSIVNGTWNGAEFTEGQGSDKALKLIINNQSDPVYINVTDLSEVYTAGNGIDVSNLNSISIKIDNSSNPGILSVSGDGLKISNIYNKTEINNMINNILDRINYDQYYDE